MEKIKIKIPKISKKNVKFGDTNIKIKSIIDVDDYSIIMKDLKDNFFDKENMSIYIIELRIIRNVLSLCTNIDIESISNVDLMTDDINSFIANNIENYIIVLNSILEEFKFYRLQRGFGLISQKMPSVDEVEKMSNSFKNAINEIDSKKLEVIAKSIVWNKSPELGGLTAPAIHEVKE